MDLDPSPNAGVYCYSVRVSVIVKTSKLQHTKNFLSFMERIPYNHSNTILEKIALQINIS